MRYPEIKVKLVGKDGNAFAILGNVRGALRKGGVHESEVKEFLQEAMSGDYTHMLVTCSEWVDVSA